MKKNSDKYQKSIICRSFFDNVNNASINYCHWKSIDHLDASFSANTDLDVLVSLSDANKFENIAKQFGFVEFQTEALRTYPGVKDLVCYEKSINKFIHLHIHYQLVLGDRWVKAYRLPSENDILKRKIWNSNYKTFEVCPEDEYWMCVVRMCMKYRQPFKRKRVREELDSIKGRFTTISQSKISNILENYPPIFKKVSILAINSKFMEADRHSKALLKNSRVYLRYSYILFKFLSFYRFVFRVYVEVLRRKFNVTNYGRRRILKSGLSVAFVGIDGSGKTTLIDRNKKFFAKQLDVDTYFLGGGRSGSSFWRFPLFFFWDLKNKFRKNKNKNKNKDKDNASVFSQFFRYLFHIFLSFDRRYRLRKVHRARANGKLVLIDRWPQTEIIGILDGKKINQENESGNSLLNFFMKIENKSFIDTNTLKPDLIIKIKISPEKSIERKPEDLNISEANFFAKQLDKLNFHGIHTEEVDADKCIEDVDRSVRDIIWNNLK